MVTGHEDGRRLSLAVACQAMPAGAAAAVRAHKS